MSKGAGYGALYHGIGSLRDLNSSSHTPDKLVGPPDDPEGNETAKCYVRQHSLSMLYILNCVGDHHHIY